MAQTRLWVSLHQAVNIIGDSPWSEEALFTTQAALPDCPEGLQCIPEGPNSALVTWQTPADGGAPIFAYQLQRSETESNDFQPVYKGELSHCTVTGLQSGQGYKFRVLAQNEVQWGCLCPAAMHAPLLFWVNNEYVHQTVSQ